MAGSNNDFDVKIFSMIIFCYCMIKINSYKKNGTKFEETVLIHSIYLWLFPIVFEEKLELVKIFK